jgi:hypothetical protein
MLRDWSDFFGMTGSAAASVSLALGGAGLIAGAALGPFAIASASMLLLLSGIYRTWGQSLALIGMQEKL